MPRNYAARELGLCVGISHDLGTVTGFLASMFLPQATVFASTEVPKGWDSAEQLTR